MKTMISLFALWGPAVEHVLFVAKGPLRRPGDS